MLIQIITYLINIKQLHTLVYASSIFGLERQKRVWPMFYVAIFGKAPILIATRSMARIKADKAIWQMAQGIHAEIALPVKNRKL